MTRSIVEPSTRPGPDTAPRRAGRHRDHGHRRRPHLPLRLRQRPQPRPPTRRPRLGRTAGRTRGRPVRPRPAPRHAAPRPARRHTRTTPASPPTAHLRQPHHPRPQHRRPTPHRRLRQGRVRRRRPLLLIGWAEVGPSLLQAISTISRQSKETTHANVGGTDTDTDVTITNTDTAAATPTAITRHSEGPAGDAASSPVAIAPDDDLIDRARHEDARHWATHQRPISAEALRKNLRISTARSRTLVSIVRAERSGDRNATMVTAGQSPSE